jgi:hypothetical protein
MVHQRRGIDIFMPKSGRVDPWCLFRDKLAQVKAQNVHLSYNSPSTLSVGRPKNEGVSREHDSEKQSFRTAGPVHLLTGHIKVNPVKVLVKKRMSRIRFVALPFPGANREGIRIAVFVVFSDYNSGSVHYSPSIETLVVWCSRQTTRRKLEILR